MLSLGSNQCNQTGRIVGELDKILKVDGGDIGADLGAGIDHLYGADRIGSWKGDMEFYGITVHSDNMSVLIIQNEAEISERSQLSIPRQLLSSWPAASADPSSAVRSKEDLSACATDPQDFHRVRERWISPATISSVNSRNSPDWRPPGRRCR